MKLSTSHNSNKDGSKLLFSPCWRFTVLVSHGPVGQCWGPFAHKDLLIDSSMSDGTVDFELYSSQPLGGWVDGQFFPLLYFALESCLLAFKVKASQVFTPITPVAAVLTFDLGTRQVTTGRQCPLPPTSPAHLTGWLINPPHPAGRITLPAHPDLRWPRRTFR